MGTTTILKNVLDRKPMVAFPTQYALKPRHFEGGRGNADDGQTILEQGEVGDLGLDRHGASVLGLDGLEGLEERSIGSGSGASGVGGNDVVSSVLSTF